MTAETVPQCSLRYSSFQRKNCCGRNRNEECHVANGYICKKHNFSRELYYESFLAAMIGSFGWLVKVPQILAFGPTDALYILFQSTVGSIHGHTNHNGKGWQLG